ncbi:replication protein, partial [Oleidesulfovibrio alaskensis]
ENENKDTKFKFPVGRDMGELSGFTGIPNRFLLMIPLLKLTSSEISIMLILYRITIGYWKQSRPIKQVELMRYAAVSKCTVINSLKRLNALGLITYKNGTVTVNDIDGWDIDLARSGKTT